MKAKLNIITAAALLLCFTASCKKDWLDKKRDISLIVPTTLKDFRLLLNENFPDGLDCRGIAELAADDYTISDVNYNALSSTVEKEGYIWKDDLYKGSHFEYEWNQSYSAVLNANVILDGLKKITPDQSNQVEYNDIMGGALFRRANAFFNVAQLYARPYDQQTAGSDPGIPLRLNADINAPSARASVQQTYDQITGDLLSAAKLLKITPTYKTNASRAAAYGLLARCYLSMREYEKARQYADLALKDNNKLIDYNTLTASTATPFAMFNDEVVYDAEIYSAFLSFSTPINRIDATLYSSYDANDLRRKLLFTPNSDGSLGFVGTYSGQSLLFGGIATDELYLVRAECAARAGDTGAALSDLNTLLKQRFKTGSFVPYATSDPAMLLTTILLERRKELVMRGLRWTDLRRLNKEPQFAVTLSKTVNGTTYTLAPNDPHYTFLIPDYVIAASGIPQNER